MLPLTCRSGAILAKLATNNLLQDVSMNQKGGSKPDGDGHEERWMILAEMSSVLGIMLHTLGSTLPSDDPELVASGFDDARNLLEMVTESTSDLAASLEALPPHTQMNLDLDAETIDRVLGFMRLLGMALATHGSLTVESTSTDRASVIRSVATLYKSASKMAGTIAKRIRERGSVIGVAAMASFAMHFVLHHGHDLACCPGW
jgi:hypothetical protein